MRGDAGGAVGGLTADGRRLTAAVTVLGVGNALVGDDGVGVALAEVLAAGPLPAGVRVRVAGSDPLAVVEELSAGNTVLLLDACRWGGPPGGVRLLRLDDPAWPDLASPLSLHGLDLRSAFLLAQTLGLPLERAWLMGVEPAHLAAAEGLSPAVRHVFPALVAAARRAVARLREGLSPTYPLGAPERAAPACQGVDG